MLISVNCPVNSSLPRCLADVGARNTKHLGRPDGKRVEKYSLKPVAAKAAELLGKGIHLLILDLLPPGKRDPEGLHNEIWQEVAGVEYTLPAGRPLTLAAYDSGDGVRAYVVHAGVGAALASMPLFLEPRKAVDVPLEATYNAAFADVPRRWRRVLDSS